MSFFTGSTLSRGSVTLTGLSDDDLPSLADDRYRQNFVDWRAAAASRPDALYFVIRDGGRPVGQIFLHDIDSAAGEAGVGYYLLTEGERNRGIGTAALALLVDYVRAETTLKRLVAMTGSGNVRSRRVAEKNGFVYFQSRPRPERADGSDLLLFRLSLTG
jgi:RimJ/RimL family protein N-acetyltransferase